MTTSGEDTTDRGLVLEIGALVLLTLGSVVSWVGWAGGVLLVWTSDRWTRSDKLVGTLVLPGGLTAAWWFARGPATTTCAGFAVDGRTPSCPDSNPLPLPVMVAVQLVLLVAPLAAAAWLGWRLRRTG